MQNFKDNFSAQSHLYAKYRPSYPPGLFGYLASLVSEHDLAWDCGTGNGQSATGLTPYFKSVYATDPSEAQIRHSLAHEQIRYRVEKAEEPDLPDGSVDLITVAQALHWFDFDKFYAAAKRVLKKKGIMAAWAYGLPHISVKLDQEVKHFHDEILGEYWLPENRLIEKEYTTVPFPFERMTAPPFMMQKELSFAEFTGWVSSWSAVQRYTRKNARDPVPAWRQELLRLWGKPDERKTVSWKLILLVGSHNTPDPYNLDERIDGEPVQRV